jgi:hypothetical protein
VDSVIGTLAAGVALNASGIATFSTAALPAGAHTITAYYHPNADFRASNSSVTKTVAKVQATASQPTLSVASPSFFGQTVTFTTAVMPNAAVAPTGAVTFLDGPNNVSLGTGAVNAGTREATFSTSSLSVGTHVIKAQYLGDSNYFESAVTWGTGLRVQSLTTTTLTITPAGTQLVHTPLTFTAAVKASGGGAPNPTTGQGTVKFLDTASGTLAAAVALDASGVATFSTSTLSTGVHTITAIYSGATDYRTSHQAVTKTIVLKFQASTNIASSVNPADAHHVITFTATVHPTGGSTANPTGTVTFKDTFNGTTKTLGTATLTLVNGLMQATFSTSSLSVGKNTIAATYNGNTDFFSSTSGNLVETVNASATTGAALSSAPPWITVWANGPLDMSPLDDWFRRQENW